MLGALHIDPSFVQNFAFFSILLAILAGIFCLPSSSRHAKRLTLSAIFLILLMSLALLGYTAHNELSFTYRMGHFDAPFGNEIRAGSLEALLAVVFSAVMLFALIGGQRDTEHDIPEPKRHYYYLMFNMLLAAMLAIIYTNDIFTAYVFIEILTISACSIIMIKPGGQTLVATTIYLIMSLIGSSLLLLAIGMLYSITGHLLMPDLQRAILLLMETDLYRFPLFIIIGLMTAGLAIKSALFPFHAWLPDAHASATTSSSAVLSGLIIKSYLVLLIKLFYRVFDPETIATLQMDRVLLFCGLCGLLWGALKALRQQHIKRMLSYATISQIGYICLGLGLNNPAGYAAACFHLITHAIAKPLLFLSAGGLSAASQHKKDLPSLQGAARRDPLSGAGFLCGALAMIGIPLFSGFVSKLYLAEAAMDHPWARVSVPVLILAGTVLSAMYYLPVIIRILSPPADAEGSAPTKSSILSWLSIGGLIALTFLLGLSSQPIMQLIHRGLHVLGPNGR